MFGVLDVLLQLTARGAAAQLLRSGGGKPSTGDVTKTLLIVLSFLHLAIQVWQSVAAAVAAVAAAVAVAAPALTSAVGSGSCAATSARSCSSWQIAAASLNLCTTLSLDRCPPSFITLQYLPLSLCRSPLDWECCWTRGWRRTRYMASARCRSQWSPSLQVRSTASMQRVSTVRMRQRAGGRQLCGMWCYGNWRHVCGLQQQSEPRRACRGSVLAGPPLAD